MKKAIVTGANGFVGSAVVQALVKQGTAVIALDRSGCSDNLPKNDQCTFIPFKLSDTTEIERELQGCGADVFYHFAWAASTGAARGDYCLQLKNVQGAVDAINLAAKLGCKRFVGAGTLAEQDTRAYMELDASTPNAVSCYGTAKMAAHYMSKAEANRLEIEHIWARFPNIYGAGNRTDNFANYAVKLMLLGKPANFTAAEQLYDFIHIRDAVQALVLLGDKGRPNYSYYVGSGRSLPLKAYIEMIRDAIDPMIILNFGAIPFNGVSQPQEVFDCNKLMSHTGYVPQVSFEVGIQEMVMWMKKEIAEEIRK